MNNSTETAAARHARRIRALLAKAADPGVTEAEALVFGEKARELLEQHQLSLSDLELTAAGTYHAVVPFSASPIHTWIGLAVGRYCESKSWISSASKKIHFLGLRADAEFAGWLYSSLTDFIQRQQLAYSFDAPSPPSRAELHDFMAGCGTRISERLNTLTQERRAAAAASQLAASGRNALTISRSRLVAETFSKLGITLSAGRDKSAGGNAGAFAAGRQAGNAAGFGRPVGASAAPKLLR